MGRFRNLVNEALNTVRVVLCAAEVAQNVTPVFDADSGNRHDSGPVARALCLRAVEIWEHFWTQSGRVTSQEL